MHSQCTAAGPQHAPDARQICRASRVRHLTRCQAASRWGAGAQLAVRWRATGKNQVRRAPCPPGKAGHLRRAPRSGPKPQACLQGRLATPSPALAVGSRPALCPPTFWTTGARHGLQPGTSGWAPLQGLALHLQRHVLGLARPAWAVQATAQGGVSSHAGSAQACPGPAGERACGQLGARQSGEDERPVLPARPLLW